MVDGIDGIVNRITLCPASKGRLGSSSWPDSARYIRGDSDVFSFDSNTGRLSQYQSNVNGQAVTGVLNWNANGTLGSLAITDPLNSQNAHTCTYSRVDHI